MMLPDWVQRILSGNATQKDYNAALEFDAQNRYNDEWEWTYYPGAQELLKQAVRNAYIDVMLNIALGEVGYHEGWSMDDEDGTNNHTKYGDWYYNQKVSGNNYPWCATFVSWCANEAGIPDLIVPRYEGCWGGRSWYND